MYNSKVAAEKAGISYDQLKYWRQLLPEAVQPERTSKGFVWCDRGVRYLKEIVKLKRGSGYITHREIRPHLRNLYETEEECK